MKFANLLQSGFTFTENEHELRLKYILFNSLLLTNIVLVLSASLLRFTTGDLMQGGIDSAYVVMAVFVTFLARKSRKLFQTLVLIIIFFSLAIVALTYLFISSDIAGIAWFMITILVAFFLTGRKTAYTLFFISLILVAAISAMSESKEHSAVDILYGLLPLLVTLVFVQFYETRNALSKDRLKVLNEELEQRVTATATELSVSEARFRNLVENFFDWVWEMDKNGVYAYASPSVQQILGYLPSDIEGCSHRDFTYEKDNAGYMNFFHDCILTERPFKSQLISVRHKNGFPVFLEVSGAPFFTSDGEFSGYRGVSRDVSQRLDMEKSNLELKEHLHQAQKMEAIGNLAGGIAHDFNNILSAILGYAEIAKWQLPKDREASKSVEQIITAGKRATELVKQILTFSRKGDEEKKPLRVDLVVKEALKLLRSSLPTTIDIQTSIDSESGLVLADPTNIHQIVVNLCTNASHAIGNSQGLLQVNVSRVDVHGEQILDVPQVQAGSFILLTVSDSGTGMDTETAARIFEPYFTTKKQEEGTGLGLAVIHAIVEGSHGFIRVESHPGEGTSFQIYLPNVQQSETLLAEPVAEKELLPVGNEQILIIDDEENLTEIVNIHLSKLGYRVTTRTKSSEALALFLADVDFFDLVITDQTMPEVTGAELTQAMLSVQPHLPIILYTGYSSTLSKEDAYGIGVKSFMEKPVSMKLLARTVRHLLDGC